MEPWYEDGLQFECKSCGNCCGGSPGHVWVSDEEIGFIAAHLGMDEGEFRWRYVIASEAGSRLTERQNDDCIFFNRAHGCVVYEVRPRQCRTWPFWRSIVATPEGWADASQSCPGMNQGQTHSIGEIESFTRKDGFP